jgi:hypothetical protein
MMKMMIMKQVMAVVRVATVNVTEGDAVEDVGIRNDYHHTSFLFFVWIGFYGIIRFDDI